MTNTFQKSRGLDANIPAIFQDPYILQLSQSIEVIVNRWPEHFESDLSQEFHRFIGHLDATFKDPRQISVLTKLFCSHYLMRKATNRSLNLFPQKRILKTRLISSSLNFPFHVQPVLGIIVTISLHDLNERFGEKHMTSAVLALIPDVEVINKSFYACHSNLDSVHTLYLEIVKKEGLPFSFHEKRVLKHHLAGEMTQRIELLDSTTFNLHREEEILKNIALLKGELASTPNLPQTLIFFLKHDSESITFHILLLRTLKKESASLRESFASLPVNFIHERTNLFQGVEASTFQLQIQVDASLLRTDFSINLYQARNKVLGILREAIGEVRDYNGGLFDKQQDLFSQFEAVFSDISQKNPDLLENFFRALSPSHIQATLPLEILKAFFVLFLKALKTKLSRKDECCIRFEETQFSFLTMIRADDPSFEQNITEALKKEEILEQSQASLSLAYQGSYFLGYIYPSYHSSKKSQVQRAIKKGAALWQKKIESFQSLRLSVQTIPLSLDPRIGGDEVSRLMLKLLFEGLMRMGKNELPECALAEKVNISPDRKSYLFTLRESFWNNGDRVTAHDFAYAWKKNLSPSFTSAFAHLFYPIKNARAIKEAKAGIEDVGIEIIDPYCLKVELEHPCPYFLELTAHSLYSPINARIDALHPHWPSQTEKNYICNGPFQLKKIQNEGCELTKNPLYWDSRHIKLDQILIVQANIPGACELFKNGEIDWLGRPLRPWHSQFLKMDPSSIQALPGPSVYWIVFNVQKPPFNRLKFRQALALSLQRQHLINALSYPGSPALSPLPRDQRQLSNPPEENIQKARLLLKETLKEIDLPLIKLIHNKGELREKTTQAVAEQWTQGLGIPLTVESCEWEDLFHRLSIGDFQIGLINWRSAINDPSYTLNAFRHPHEKINFSKWENSSYQTLLEKADQEKHHGRRAAFLSAAESILMQELPVIPLFDELNPYLKNPKLSGIPLTSSGNINFRNAYFSKKILTKR